MAKFEVTKKGVHGIEKGEVIELDGDKIPAWLVNKGHIVKGGKTAITNPDKAAADKAAADKAAADKAAADKAAAEGGKTPPPPAPAK